MGTFFFLGYLACVLHSLLVSDSLTLSVRDNVAGSVANLGKLHQISLHSFEFVVALYSAAVLYTPHEVLICVYLVD